MVSMAESTDGAAAGDALGEFANALTGICALGSAMLGSLTGQPDMARAAASFAPLMEPFRGSTGAADVNMAQDAADVVGFLGQTWMVAATSGFRYWRRLAEMYGEHQAGILQALAAGGLSENERRAMIDELRGYVRELGDVSLQEARVLQRELERLSLGLAESVDAGGSPGEHRRRWRAKP
jgi:hypothetical protein